MKIKTGTKKITDCRHAMSVEVDVKDVDACYAEVLAEIGKKAKLPGFRPGKAPAELVASAYADRAHEEVAQRLVSRGYALGLDKHQLRAVSYPGVRDVVLARGRKMTFTAEFDTEPQVKIKKYRGLKLKKVPAEVGPEDVDKTLESFRDSRAEPTPLEEPRPVREGDMLDCELEILQSGKVVQEKRQTRFVVRNTPGHEMFFDNLVGMSVGQTKEIGAGDGAVYKVTALEIQERRLPAADDAFAVLMGKGSMTELKEQIRKDLAEHRKSQAEEAMRNQLLSVLLEENTFAVPPSLVAGQKRRLEQEAGVDAAKLPEAEREKFEKEFRERAEKQVRLFYILERIAVEEKVEVSEEDVRRRAEEVAGSARRDPGQVLAEYGDSIRSEIRRHRVIERLLSLAETTE